jgi:hypothetical protein
VVVIAEVITMQIILNAVQVILGSMEIILHSLQVILGSIIDDMVIVDTKVRLLLRFRMK